MRIKEVEEAIEEGQKKLKELQKQLDASVEEAQQQLNEDEFDLGELEDCAKRIWSIVQCREQVKSEEYRLSKLPTRERSQFDLKVEKNITLMKMLFQLLVL